MTFFFFLNTKFKIKRDENTIRFLYVFSKQFGEGYFLGEIFEKKYIFFKIWAKKLIIYALNRLTRTNIF